MPQVMVHQHNGHHRLRNRRRPDTDTWIVPPGGNNFTGIAVHINTATRQAQTR
eukprot:CAMPEP_0181271092 /NCGR_PEP_ID=MMETSP1097-20121128/7186_1 /TAXON_ID=35684 /ORGANISM="Pseudopedinella elastica, Strain CCMP716" /LENGTH=52 /DNA_ID=CAMNT_0023371437 /DNA_START=50 /DNA_END=205 /DNA_ORIENTATION=-